MTGREKHGGGYWPGRPRPARPRGPGEILSFPYVAFTCNEEKPALYLSLHSADGTFAAITYRHFHSVTCESAGQHTAERIILSHEGGRCVLHGRHLAALADRLRQQAVISVYEYSPDRYSEIRNPAAPLVIRIDDTRHRPKRY